MAKQNKAPQLSPEKYIRTRARLLPLGPCYINAAWKKTGMAIVIVTRQHINKNITFAVFQVDLYCLGIKGAICNFNADPDLIVDLRKKHQERSEPGNSLIEVDYTLVHNILYGAVEYAEDLGFHPPKEVDTAIHLLEEDDERIELVDIEFGLHGKPAVFFGRESHPQNILAILDKSVGKSNYTVFYGDEIDSEQFANFGPKRLNVTTEDADDFDKDDFDETDEDGQDIEVIDKPLEEFDEADFDDISSGKKIMSPENLFKFLFSTAYLKLSKKERKQTDKIIEGVEKWKISEDDSENEDDLFTAESERLLYGQLYTQHLADAEKAMEPVMAAIAQFPDNFHFYNLLGMIYHATEKYDKLLPLAETLYQKFPSNVFAFCNHANLLISEGNHVLVGTRLDPQFNIHQQFPHHKMFSADELFIYLEVVIKYLLATDRPMLAGTYAMTFTLYEWDIPHETMANALFALISLALAEQSMGKNVLD